MTDEQKPQPGPLVPLSDSGSANAPMIYFDNVPTLGHLDGIIRITLTADRIYPGKTNETITIDRVMVAHLRSSRESAIRLRDAINNALLLAAPGGSETRN